MHIESIQITRACNFLYRQIVNAGPTHHDLPSFWVRRCAVCPSCIVIYRLQLVEKQLNINKKETSKRFNVLLHFLCCYIKCVCHKFDAQTYADNFYTYNRKKCATWAQHRIRLAFNTTAIVQCCITSDKQIHSTSSFATSLLSHSDCECHFHSWILRQFLFAFNLAS